jgi:hypothetical protein
VICRSGSSKRQGVLAPDVVVGRFAGCLRELEGDAKSKSRERFSGGTIENSIIRARKRKGQESERLTGASDAQKISFDPGSPTL